MPVLERIIATVAPHTCIVCGSEGQLVCNWCLPGFAPMDPPRCYLCGALSPGSRVCKNCTSKSRLNHVWVRTDYQSSAKVLVHKLKFGRVSSVAKTIAELISEALPYLSPDKLLIPIPTATKRVRQRGYDQALLITKHLAHDLRVPYVKALRRHGQIRQVGKNRKQRLEQLAGAYRVVNPEHIKGAHVILIDDVLTTGATLETAAAALRQAGARHVDAIVFAQTLRSN